MFKKTYNLQQITVILVVISIVNGQLRPLPLVVSSRDRDAIILKQNYDLNPDGSYIYK